MQRIPKVPIVLVVLLFALAAVAEVAIGRSRSVNDAETAEASRQAALAGIDQALARHDVATALRAWQDAHELARRTRSWRALVDAAEAHLRIARAANTPPAAAAPRAREIYLAALNRARADGSVEGAVRVAEGFAALGDREVTELALRIAASLAARSNDPAAALRVDVSRGTLRAPSSGLVRSVF